MSSSKQSVPKRLRARGERKSQGRPTLQWTIKRSAIDNASKIMQSASRLDRGDKERASERTPSFIYRPQMPRMQGRARIRQIDSVLSRRVRQNLFSIQYRR